MENKTVYPYGQGGSLPAGYPIADDFNTDSAQTSLSARRGKLLNEKVTTLQKKLFKEGSLTVTGSSSSGQTIISGFGVTAGHTYRIYVQSDDLVLAANAKVGLGSNGDISTAVTTAQLRTGLVLLITATTTASSSRVYIHISTTPTTLGTVKAKIEDTTDLSTLSAQYRNDPNPDAVAFVTRNIKDSGLSWDYGTISSSTGEDTASGTIYVRSNFVPIDEEPSSIRILYKGKYSALWPAVNKYYYDSSKNFLSTSYSSSAKYIRVTARISYFWLDELDFDLYLGDKLIPYGMYDESVAQTIGTRNYIEGETDVPQFASDATTLGATSLVGCAIVSGRQYHVYIKTDRLVSLLSGSVFKLGVGSSNPTIDLTPAQLFAGYDWNFTATNSTSDNRVYLDLYSKGKPGCSFRVYVKMEDKSSNSLTTPYAITETEEEVVPVDIVKSLGFGNLYGKNSFSLIHCSDIHGDADRWARISQFATDLGVVAIHTGDSLQSNWANGAWDFLSGGSNILNCIGNHDGKKGNNWFGATPKEVYDEMFAPYISGWDVVQPENAAANGLLYYYKDIATGGRLIVLDMHNVNQNAGDYTSRSETVSGYTAAQLSWFESVLADAITNNKSVIVANHYILDNMLCEIETCWDEGRSGPNFAETDSAGYGCINTEFVAAVTSFINNGGKFVCWLSGHVHRSQFSHATDGKQLQICACNASMPSYATGKHFRANLLPYQDDFNLITVYPNDGVLMITRIGSDLTIMNTRQKRIVYDYVNNKLIQSM